MSVEVSAKLRNVRLSPYKGRLVADLIRGKSVSLALDQLQFSQQKSAAIMRKVVMSAVANAENNEGADVDELRVATVTVDEGPVLKRFRARAKGRGTRILKRTSHVTVVLSDA